MEKDPYRIRDHVADFDSIVAGMNKASEAARKILPMIRAVAYGDGPSETADVFFPDAPRKDLPVHIFIHGGYWRMFSKDDYSYVATSVTQAGAIAVILDYALMPHYRMEALVDQVRRAKHWVVEHIASLGGDPSRLTISGHSAGAHLATFLFNRDERQSAIKAALLLGGLYDLAPLRQSFLQQEIALTHDEVSRFTPLAKLYDRNCRTVLTVGQTETDPFHSQMSAFATHLRNQGMQVSSRIISGRNHMSSVRDLGIPESEAGELLMQVIAAGT